MHYSFARPVLLSLGMCLAVTGLATSGLMLGGCSDARTEQLATASAGLSKTSASITQLKIRVNKTNSTLVKIKGGTDFAANYTTLKEQIAGLKENAAYIKASGEELTANKHAIIATWREEIAAVKDPVLKASAAERSAKVSESIGQITINYSEAKGAYLPYITGLDELTQFLDKDQTPSGVKVVGPIIEKSLKSGVDVQVQLQMLSSKLDALSGEISPTVK
jgi:chromosome segregation ATPase